MFTTHTYYWSGDPLSYLISTAKTSPPEVGFQRGHVVYAETPGLRFRNEVAKDRLKVCGQTP